MGTTTCTILNASTTECITAYSGTSTPPVYDGVITGGDALISFFLLCIFLTLFTFAFFRS